MRISLQKLAGLTLLSILYSALAACTAPTPLPTATLTPLAYLTPYLSPAPSQTAPAPTALTTFPVTPTVTPTPFLHVLTKDDTLLGLALRYGVSVQEILDANPGD